MIHVGREICTDFRESSSREWLETNGIGGYASATISGAGTRRYHGLLVAATRPPLGRVVLLSRFEEAITIGGQSYEISCNKYPHAVYPEGFKHLTSFRMDPYPKWTFEIDGFELERSYFMVHGENTTVCRWKVLDRLDAARGEDEAPDCQLELRPLVAFRDHHHLRRNSDDFETGFTTAPGWAAIAPSSELPTLYLAHSGAAIERTGVWYHDFEYDIERERGFDFREDLFQPFKLTFNLTSDACVIASTKQKLASQATELEKSEIRRRADIVVRSEIKDESVWPLVLATDQFIVDRGDGKTVIAGYHWFSDWGRDTMIALNGLTLAVSRPDIARSILLEFGRHISDGILPNRFPDEGETPDYNTVDATLWYFEAIRAYVDQTGDRDLLYKDLYLKLVNIIDWHVKGTRYGIHLDTDGLLFAGAEGQQLTWMDAKVGDWVVTPRIGKPVEIQALWYNALRIMESFAYDHGDVEKRSEYAERAEIARISFVREFWNADAQCLFDVINGDLRDASIRPNQIFAVSLPFSMLDAARARKVVDRVEKDLLTPGGLRTLAKHDPNYVGIYTGSPIQRDGSYHQGTVWAWLIGHFVDAYRKVHSKDPRAERRITDMLEGFKEHLDNAMLGQISEIFDGDEPHLPRGAAAQAWSVAEVLRSFR